MFAVCLITVAIEVPFLALFGYRSRDDLKITVCANVITNLLLNLIIQLVFHGAPGGWILPMELAVIVAEFLVYSAAFGASLKLWALTMTANMISYGVGLLII